MKLKNGVIYASSGVLNKLCSIDLPIKTMYTLKKNCLALNGTLEFIDARRKELLQKYMDENNKWKDKDSEEKFINDFSEVLNIEEEVDIKMIDFEELDGIRISIADFNNILFMIKLDDEKKEEN